MNHETIHEIIAGIAASRPEGEAILGLGGEPLTYGRLQGHIASIGRRLNQLGIGRNDRVAVVLPNGPQAATAFLSITSAATIAPLNPNYTTAEFEFYLADLKPKALVVEHDSRSLSLQAAGAGGVPVVKLQPPNAGPPFLFELHGDQQGTAGAAGPAKPSDVALVLHTSGTTARPKIVPLTHKNLCASARSIRDTLKLTAEDRCLNIMPLFHIHGLMAAVLASMSAGASVACAPGFLAPEFFKWLEQFKPTWYTAVPTMHQAILERARAHPEQVAGNRLRFIRSSSASLAPKTMRALEETFSAPVIEAYGMTEASHQMASNPLPPRPRKPGSVGVPAGPEIRVMSDDGARPRPAGETGEIAIRGPGVTLGYAENPEANQRSFTEGWFRTGDQGHFDADGYLFISGRLKEIINRGGEKISPREVDEVFLGHPAVAQAVTFAVPDARLGESVGIALVLRDKHVSIEELVQFASARLAFFKVPEKVIIVDEIPKGATGKVQRIGLAAKLGLVQLEQAAAPAAAQVYVAPRNEREQRIAEIWQEVLNVKRAGIQDRFRDLGGDSMLATVIHTQLETAFDLHIPLADLYRASTITAQAELLERLLTASQNARGSS